VSKAAIIFNVGMNDEIRQRVRQRMKEKGLSTYKLADLVETVQPNISRILSGRSGSIPELWVKVFDALGLELTVKEKGPGKE
jgi:transcriptional regulator with XRE-family HTH domain